MIKAVLFDFDETLQDRTSAFESYMNAFIKEFFPNISMERADQMKEEMLRTGNGGYVMDNGYKNRDEWYADLIKRWNWKDSPSPEELTYHYDSRFGDFVDIFPEAPAVLEKLRDTGYKVGVVTNGPSLLQHHKMDVSNLNQYCDIVVVSGDIGIDKPDSGIFIYSANLLNFKCSECVYVGDHPVNDIEGALNAGMIPIRMNYGWFKNTDLRTDVPIISNLNELPNCISLLNEKMK